MECEDGIEEEEFEDIDYILLQDEIFSNLENELLSKINSDAYLENTLDKLYTLIKQR